MSLQSYRWMRIVRKVIANFWPSNKETFLHSIICPKKKIFFRFFFKYYFSFYWLFYCCCFKKRHKRCTILFLQQQKGFPVNYLTNCCEILYLMCLPEALTWFYGNWSGYFQSSNEQKRFSWCWYLSGTDIMFRLQMVMDTKRVCNESAD